MARSHLLLVDTLPERGIADADLPGPGTSASANQCESANSAPNSVAARGSAGAIAGALVTGLRPGIVDRLLGRDAGSRAAQLPMARRRAVLRWQVRTPNLDPGFWAGFAA